MRTRCTKPSHVAWPRYGGRGIRVCSRWLDFRNFIADMGPKPSPHHSLDRFPNNDGNYTPTNCRWATRKEQARNAGRRRLFTVGGRTQYLTEWAQETGITISTLWARIHAGWKPDRVVTTPVLHRAKSCKRGHLFRRGSYRWEGKSRRCLICKREYDRQYRMLAPGWVPLMPKRR